VYSCVKNPEARWEAHFQFARAASAYAIRFLGNEARLPRVEDVLETERRYSVATPLPA
jgi:sulfofructose kinase